MASPPDSGSGKPKPGAPRPPSPRTSPGAKTQPELLPPHMAPPTVAPTPAGGPPPSPKQRPQVPPRPPPVLSTPAVIVPPAPPAAPRAAAAAAPPARASAAPVPTPASTASAAGLDRAQLQELEQRAAQLNQMDYFQLLKLQTQAAPAEIKAAFYRESRTYHPDRFFQLPDKAFKEKVSAVYKRLTEAYYVLRDDVKRKRYAADIASPERNAKLRFTEATETETKQQVKKEQEEQIGVHPKGRQFYATAMKDADSGNLAGAERNLKMAITFEPSNARYKEKLTEVQQRLHEEQKKQGHAFKIR